MFNFLKIDDPYLGDNTYGHIARLGPERCMVMHHQLMELEDSGWETKEEFRSYQKAYATVATAAVQEYLDKAAAVFFERFRAIFDKHMVTKWTSTEVVHYLLGGDKHHAKEFARWLVYHKTKVSSGDSSTSAITPIEEDDINFSFEEKVITLGEHHNSRINPDRAIQIDLQESMLFLTENANPVVILKDPFVVRNWKYIVALSEEEDAIDLFPTTEDGGRGDSNWEDTNYDPFVEDIIRSISIHASHSQRCENTVQLCGFVSITKVGQVRRTCRALIHTIVHRRFNPWARRMSNQRRKEEDEKSVIRVRGGERMALFIDYWTDFYNEKVLPAKEFAPGLWTDVRGRLANNSMKSSCTEQLHRLEKFEECLEKEPKYTKTTKPVGIDETSRTSGKVVLKILTKSNQTYLRGTGMDIESLVQAELKARDLEKKVDKEASLVKKRHTIRLHEYMRIHESNTLKEWKENDVKEITPLSKEMKSFVTLGYYNNILGGINATVMLEIEK